MKKALLILTLLATYAAAIGQCYNSPNGLPEGFYPVNDSIPCINRFLPSSTTITFNCPNSLTVSGVSLPIRYIIFDSIINLPCGLAWNVTNNNVQPTEAACIYFHGNVIDSLGQYELKIRARVKVALFPNELTLDLDELGHPVYLRVKENQTLCSPLNTSTPSNLSNCNPIPLPGNSNTVSGHIFIDANQNGVFDSLDQDAPNFIVNIGNTQIFTNSNGNYIHQLPMGSHIVAPDTNAFYSVTTLPTEYLLNYSTANNLDTGLNFGLTITNYLTDALVTSTSTNLRLGSIAPQTICVVNYGTNPVTPVLHYYYDTTLQFLLANITPDAQTSGYLIWELGTLQPMQSACIIVSMQLPTNTNLIGTQISTIAFVETYINDIDVSNDTIELVQEITAAYDPNDKTAYPSQLSESFVDSSNYITYRIRFQNTGNDTAFNITVRDTISSPHLDINSLMPLTASHPYAFKIEGNKVAVWEFKNILLPDSSVNEAASNGFIFFRIKINNDNLVDGTEILNQAGIYFDINPVIMTEPSIAKVDFSTSIRDVALNNSSITIYPNPAQNHLIISHQQWQQGASIVLYDLTGKAMLTQPLSGKTTEVSTASLPNGMYLYQVLGASGMEGLGKVVIAR